MEDEGERAAEEAQIAEDLESEAMLEREIYGDAVDEESDNMDAGVDQKETNKKEAEQDKKEANKKEAEQDEMVQDKPEETNGDNDLYNEDENEPQEEPEETNEDEEIYEQPQDGETDPETEDEASDNEMQMDATEKQGNDPFGDYEDQASNADDANEDYWPVLGQYGRMRRPFLRSRRRRPRRKASLPRRMAISREPNFFQLLEDSIETSHK